MSRLIYPISRDKFIEMAHYLLKRGMDMIISKGQCPHDETSGQVTNQQNMRSTFNYTI